MSKREIVVLVSRALAIIQAITAVLDLAYLPEHLMVLSRHVNELNSLPMGSHLFDYDASLLREDRIYLAFLTLRIGILCLAALLFWRCGPFIERMLSPSTVEGKASDQTGSA
jgi:hypothetical protein